jgi:hypothetical protein
MCQLEKLFLLQQLRLLFLRLRLALRHVVPVLVELRILRI